MGRYRSKSDEPRAICDAVDIGKEREQRRWRVSAELGPLDGDAVHDDADGLAERLDGVVLVPDLAAVELAALRASAVKREALADGGCGGSG